MQIKSSDNGRQDQFFKQRQSFVSQQQAFAKKLIRKLQKSQHQIAKISTNSPLNILGPKIEELGDSYERQQLKKQFHFQQKHLVPLKQKSHVLEINPKTDILKRRQLIFDSQIDVMNQLNLNMPSSTQNLEESPRSSRKINNNSNSNSGNNGVIRQPTGGVFESMLALPNQSQANLSGFFNSKRSSQFSNQNQISPRAVLDKKGRFSIFEKSTFNLINMQQKQPEMFEQHLDISKIIKQSRAVGKRDAAEFIRTHSCFKDVTKMHRDLELSYNDLKAAIRSPKNRSSFWEDVWREEQRELYFGKKNQLQVDELSPKVSTDKPIMAKIPLGELNKQHRPSLGSVLSQKEPQSTKSNSRRNEISSRRTSINHSQFLRLADDLEMLENKKRRKMLKDQLKVVIGNKQSDSISQQMIESTKEKPSQGVFEEILRKELKAHGNSPVNQRYELMENSIIQSKLVDYSKILDLQDINAITNKSPFRAKKQSLPKVKTASILN
ncbi:UNKNOWN [Stylonychia lemnae]|uniref:Uncharacterized protein n=1 Tax=Stylonychia lemnae TaxID=5949 RepID=A0A078B8V1_STYLE|nr:UNKNOWN [Stylonychia lemnae]|eukprot:CDW90920.1 UNKNOWN [Stylonychia lemnae]